MTSGAEGVVGDRAKELDQSTVAGLINGQLDQDILVIIQPEWRGNGERHFVLINVDALPSCIVTGVIRERLRGDVRAAVRLEPMLAGFSPTRAF